MRTTTEQVLELAEVYEQMPHVLLREANRKSQQGTSRKTKSRWGIKGTNQFLKP